MTDYKQLCAELHAALEKHDLSLADDQLLDRSAAALRAALAEPEPQGPTDEELMNLLPLYSYEDGLYDGFFQPGSLPSDWGDEDDYIASPRAILVFARAVLARWGNHPGSPDRSLQPVPVSERLPEPEDCDTEGRCWTWAIGTWRLSRINRSIHSHWLPAPALPQPS